jgi:drug/metabolite transporter (DMT)-like permease
VTRGYVPLMLVLAAIWGASYLFIKVAVAELEPTAMIALRLVLAAAVLVAVLVRRIGRRAAVTQLRRSVRQGIVLGVVNAAFPFTLIAWGEKHVDSGVAAIANASVPIFVALLAIRFRPSERVRGVRLGGVLVGIVGVVVLAGVHPRGGWWAVAGTLAVVVASVSYAAANLYAQRYVAEASGPVLATASIVCAAAIMLPFGLAQLPAHVPSWKVLGSVAALGIGGTALAQLVFYRALRLYGASRASLVTYLLPVTALAYGISILGEPLTYPELAGLALILAGVALGSGVLRRSRVEPVTQAP